MSDSKRYPVPTDFAARAYVKAADYEALYRRSIEDREGFWAQQAGSLVTWMKAPTHVVTEDLARGHIRWFEDGVLNVSANCLDRHLATRADRAALATAAGTMGM